MQIVTALIADRMAALLNTLVEQGRTPADVVAHHNIAQMPKVLAAIASGAMVGPQADEFVRHLQEALARDREYFGRQPLVSNPARMAMMSQQQQTMYLARIYFGAFALEFLNILGIFQKGATPASQAISQWLPLVENMEVSNDQGSVALCRLSRHVTIPANIFQEDVLTRVPNVVLGLRNRNWLAEIGQSAGVTRCLNVLKQGRGVDGQTMGFDQIMAMAIDELEGAVIAVARLAGVALPALYPADVGGIVQPQAQVAPVPVDNRPVMRRAVCVYLETTDGDVVLVGRGDDTHGLPGGKVEEGESLVEAAIREAYEEVGVELDAEDLHLVHAGVCAGGADGRAFHTTTFYCSQQVDADELYSEEDLEILLVEADDPDIIENSAFPEYNEKVLDAVAELRETFRV